MQNNVLPEDFREFIYYLNEFNVEYLIIGGYAVGAYGHIRATKDLDVFINPTKENAQKLTEVCIAFKIPKDQLKIEMFQLPAVVDIGDEPFKIELLKKLDVIDFDLAFKRANRIKVDDLIINVISLDDLILLKKAALNDRNEPRDKEDLEFLLLRKE